MNLKQIKLKQSSNATMKKQKAKYLSLYKLAYTNEPDL